MSKKLPPATLLRIQHECALRIGQWPVTRHHCDADGPSPELLDLVEAHKVPGDFIDDDGKPRNAPPLPIH